MLSLCMIGTIIFVLFSPVVLLYSKVDRQTRLATWVNTNLDFSAQGCCQILIIPTNQTGVTQNNFLICISYKIFFIKLNSSVSDCWVLSPRWKAFFAGIAQFCWKIPNAKWKNMHRLTNCLEMGVKAPLGPFPMLSTGTVRCPRHIQQLQKETFYFQHFSQIFEKIQFSFPWKVSCGNWNSW